MRQKEGKSMKRISIVLCALLAAFLCLPALAAEEDSAVDASKARSLISADLNGNYDAIKEAAGGLTETQRLNIYDYCKKDPISDGLLGAGVNFFVGFGVGNFIIGDKSGGTLGLVMDLVISGIMLASGSVVFISTMNMIAGWGPTSDIVMVAYYTMLGASSLITLSRVIQLISPFNYVQSYNRKLFSALSISRSSSGSVGPILAYADEDGVKPALGLSVRL
jgi:hypothetical protein